MKCPKCNSSHTTIEIEAKPFPFAPVLLIVGVVIGFPLFVVGAFPLGCIGYFVGRLLESKLPPCKNEILVCLDCDYTSKPMNHIENQKGHPLFCSAEESNLVISRNDVEKGTIIAVRITIDEYEPFDIWDNSTTFLRLPNGKHTVSYEQMNGPGKGKNKGQIDVTIRAQREINIAYDTKKLIVSL